MAMPDPPGPSPTPTPMPTSPGFIPVSDYLENCKGTVDQLGRGATFTVTEISQFLGKQIAVVKASEL